MKRFKKKMLLMCSIALILSGMVFLSSCEFLGPNTVGAGIAYTAWWAGYSFFHGGVEGAVQATIDSGKETENLEVIKNDWNNFWDSIGIGISDAWKTMVSYFTDLTDSIKE